MITSSIVLYNNDIAIVKKAIDSFLSLQLDFKLYLIDNSQLNTLKAVKSDERIVYVHNPANPGFGAAHNMAIEMALREGSAYHFIVNPDIYFDTDVVSPMVKYMDTHPDVGMMMPEILYPDGAIQHLPKLLPSPFWILKRKFKSGSQSYKKFIDRYELRNVPPKCIYNVPILSGCFSALNMAAIKKVGGYDDRYFMYFEDFDLSRRVHAQFKTLYYPEVSVYHEYEGGANKNPKLFRIFIQSAITYFNKWGWLIDKSRTKMNAETLAQFN